jgi:hypothetical protein
VRVVNDCGPVNEAKVRFMATGGGTVDGASSVDVITKKTVVGADNVARDGIAECTWNLDPATPVQHVFATIVYVPGGMFLPPQPTVYEFLARIEQDGGADPGIHVRGVRIAGGKTIGNDHEIGVKDFVRGIDIAVDGAIEKLAVELSRQTPHPTVSVAIYLPYPLSKSDEALWPPQTAGTHPLLAYQSLVVAAEVGLSLNRKTIQWRIGKPVIRWIESQLLPGVKPLGLERVLARLTLEGNFIWRTKRGPYLDGEVFGDQVHSTAKHVEAVLPQSGDKHRGGTFDMWFWLASKSDT